MYPYGPMWGIGPLGSLIWIVVIIIIIALIVRLARGPRDHRHWHDLQQHRHASAFELLKERYVKGEITKEQFDQMKRDIE